MRRMLAEPGRWTCTLRAGGLLLLIALATGALAPWAAADSYFFATATDLDTDPNGFFVVNTTTFVSTRYTPTGPDGNSLGYDPARQLLIHGTGDNNDWNVYSRRVTWTGAVPTDIADTPTYNPTTDLRADFGASWPGGASNTHYDLSGAGEYQNGTYYVIPDTQVGGEPGFAAPNNVLMVRFNASGSAIASTSVVTVGTGSFDFGNYGDTAVRGTTLYGISQIYGLYTLDLAKPWLGVTTLNAAITSGQLAFDTGGTLWTNDGNLVTPIYEINPATGAIVGSSHTLTGNLPTQWGDFATGGQIYSDWGDLPNTYAMTTLAQNGARHLDSTFERLGSMSVADTEDNGQSSASAAGDDLNGFADEDGVVFINGQFKVTMSVLDYTATRYDGGTDATNVHLRGFIDLNNDGDFDDLGEQVSYDGDPNTWGGNTHVETFTPTFAAGMLPGQIPIYSRWRFAYGTDLSIIVNPTGAALTGEVEDYLTAPEPATVVLLLGGLGMLARRRRRGGRA